MAETPEYFDNIVLGQYSMTGVPLKVYANDRYYIIPSPEDVDDPLIGYGMTGSGKMEPFDYRDIEHIMVSGNKVDLATYVKALGDELKGVAKANADKGGEEEKKEGGEEEKKEEEGGGANPFESFDPYSKKWSLKSLVELSKDEFKAQQDALKAEMEAGKAKIKAAKDKMSDLKKQPIEDGVINEIGFGDQDLQAIHFETDPEKQKKLKLAYGAKFGGITSREKIEDADYDLKRFRKQIKFGDGTNLGPFVPGSYEAINSELGDGPHARKQRKPQSWNQRSYNKWIEDMASGGGADHAYDMAQNAKLEPGLLQWVKRNLVNGETPLERIQYDIEALAESSFSTKPIVESVISDILVIAFESTTYEKFISELISQKLLKRSDLKDPELVDELKTMYRSQALGKRESVNELKLTSYGVKELLSAIYYNWNKLKPALRQKMHFNSFKDIIAYIKSGDQEEQARLKAFVQSQGIEIVALESVNEYRELNPKMVNNFKIGDTIKTQKGTYTITGFGRRANAFREFEAENEKGKPFNLRISLRGATGISAAAGAYNLNFPEQEEMLESILESVNETHISEPYIFQVGDVIRNTNPQCKHFGSMGIVQSVMDMDDNIGQLIKYLVTNYGDTFKPGMSLTKTPDQLEPMDDYDNDYSYDEDDYDDYDDYEIEYDDDDIDESVSINEYGATPSKKNWLGWFVLNANLNGDLTAWKKGELIKAYKSDEKGYVFIYTGDYNYDAYDDIAQSDFNRIATPLDPTKHKKSYNYVKKLEKLNRLEDYEVIN
jgi:hypothetical protein